MSARARAEAAARKAEEAILAAGERNWITLDDVSKACGKSRAFVNVHLLKTGFLHVAQLPATDRKVTTMPYLVLAMNRYHEAATAAANEKARARRKVLEVERAKILKALERKGDGAC